MIVDLTRLDEIFQTVYCNTLPPVDSRRYAVPKSAAETPLFFSGKKNMKIGKIHKKK